VPRSRASPFSDDERIAIERQGLELDRLGEGSVDPKIAESALADSSIKRLITITGVNLR
jgi:hypothetical protein